MHLFGLPNTFRGISRLSILYLCSILPREVLVQFLGFLSIAKKMRNWPVCSLYLSLTSIVQLQTLHRVGRSSLNLTYLGGGVPKPRYGPTAADCLGKLSLSKGKCAPLLCWETLEILHL